MNTINLIGRITKELELRYTNNNKAVCDFSIAVNRTYTNEEGEKEADFINIQVWGKQAENLKKYQGKGSLIAVNGSLRVDAYQDKEGKNKYKTYVLANNIEYVSSKSTKEENNYEEEIQHTSIKDIPITDEDLPF